MRQYLDFISLPGNYDAYVLTDIMQAVEKGAKRHFI